MRPLIGRRAHRRLTWSAVAIVAGIGCSAPAATGSTQPPAPQPPPAAQASPAPPHGAPTTAPTGDQTAPPAAAPAAAPAANVDPALKARVDAYWAARMAMNLAVAYTFYDSTFRAAYNEQQFLQNFQRLLRFRPEYLGIDKVSYAPSKTVATVTVKLRTRPAELDGMELVSTTDEKWQRTGDTWFKQGEPLLPDFGR